MIALVAVLGPLLALPRRTHLPVIVGELLAGIVLGPTLLGYLDSTDPTFTFLADIGFALIMFVAGSHVPMRDPAVRSSLGPGALRAGLVAVLAAAVAFGLAALFGTGNGPLYAVLMASSSAALILPIVDSLGLGGPPVVALLPQIALADTACIVALPLVINPANAARAAVVRCWCRPLRCWSSSCSGPPNDPARAISCTSCRNPACSRWNCGSA